jgi:hypothetical protein
MTDKTEFSFEMTLGHSMSHAPAQELFAFDECKVYPLPDRKLLLRNPHNGKSAVVMPEVLSALALCREFRDMREHVARVELGMKQLRGQPDEIRRVLESMQRDGLLISADELLTDLGIGTMDAMPADLGPAVVVIITWERPGALRRLLDSIDAHGEPSCFDTLYVVDDSRNPECISKNREAVELFAEGSAIPTRYFGREQQQALLADMAKKVPEHRASLRFLADPERWSEYWTSGLARNYALLLSVGKRLVMLDDDALFQVYQPQHQAEGVTLSNGLREAEFFDQLGEWEGMRLQDGTDPVRAHLECLGLTFREAVGKLSGGKLTTDSLAGSTAFEVRRVHADSQLLSTQCGTVGDPGTGGNTWLLELQGRSKDRMLESEESVKRAISNHNAWVGRSRAQISSRPTMSLITGLDNREDLPPYFPALRGEDRLFGSMLRHLFPESATLDYPWAAPHVPVEERDRARRETDFGARPAFPRFFLEWIQLQAERSQAGSYEGRLEKLAGFYAELASMCDAELTELFRDEMTRSACSTLVELQAALKQAEQAPRNWVEYLTKGRDRVNADLVESFGDAAISGAPGGIEGAELFALWREHWRAFGAALRAWPEIRSAASICAD